MTTLTADHLRLHIEITPELVTVIREAAAGSPLRSVPRTAGFDELVHRDDAAAVIERFRRLHAQTATFIDDRVTGRLQLLPALAAAPHSAPTFAGDPLVVMGGNVGAGDALVEVLAHLPGDLAAPVVVHVLHAAWIADPLLERLRRHSRLPVERLVTGTELHPGVVYLAPARGHSSRLVERRGALVAIIEAGSPARAPRALDGLLDAAVAVAGGNTVAVVLSGAGPDGAAGAERVVAAGGTVLVQEPSTVAAAGAAEGLALRGVGHGTGEPRHLGAAVTAAVADIHPRAPLEVPAA